MITQSLPSLNIFQSCINCFIGYCEFSGRGRRSEFWWFSLIYSMISGIFNSILTKYMNFDYFYYTDKSSKIELENFQAFLFFVGIFLFGEILMGIPFFAASTRRLHDIGYSGYYNYLFMIPIANFFLLYLWTVDSQVAPNIYGPSPKYVQKVSLINNNIPLEQPLENQQKLLTNETGSKPFNSGEQNNNQLRQKPNIKQKIIIDNEQYNKSNDKKDLINDEKNEDSKDKEVNLIYEEEHKETNEEKEEIINVEEGENNIDKDETSSKEENNN